MAKRAIVGLLNSATLGSWIQLGTVIFNHCSILISHLCLCVTDANRRKKRLTHSRLPPMVKKPIANCKYFWFSVYVESLILGIANICDLLLIDTDVTYDHHLGRNPYASKRPLKDPKNSGTLFLLPFFHPLLSRSYWLLLKGLEWTRLRFLTPRSWDSAHIRRAGLLFSFYWFFCSWLLFLHRIAVDFSFEPRN